jgi:hypothetical protein
MILVKMKEIAEPLIEKKLNIQFSPCQNISTTHRDKQLTINNSIIKNIKNSLMKK